MLDEPQALPETHGFATSGWNAVPVGGAVVARIAPLLGIEPRFDLPKADQLILASAKASSEAAAQSFSAHSAQARSAHAHLAARIPAFVGTNGENRAPR